MSDRRIPGWLARALPLLLIVIVPFFFIGGPDFLSSPLFRSVWDFGHIGFFALLLIVVQWRKPLTHWRQWLLVAALVFILGGVIEIVQAYVGRDGNWGDVFKNLVGAALGLFWGQQVNRRIWIGRMLSVIALLPSLWSVVQVALVEYESSQRFPLLGSFEKSRDLMYWEGDIARTKTYTSHGEYSLKITLATTQYAGVTFDEFVEDWGKYQQLRFDIYNPGNEPLPLVLRIHDEVHDLTGLAFNNRFNQPLSAVPGWNHFVIPLVDVQQAPAEREMDLQKLRGLSIFTIQLARERVIYLDNVRLE
jgi:hypothetical protein